LAPVWETLGEKYAKNSNIVMYVYPTYSSRNHKLTTSAQMDATLNDIPPSAPFKVQGFPTLKFKPAGSLEFIDYNGDRSLESLIEFVEINKRSADVEDEDEVEEEEDDVIEHDEL
jgi:protein disulfide-isomerase A1